MTVLFKLIQEPLTFPLPGREVLSVWSESETCHHPGGQPLPSLPQHGVAGKSCSHTLTAPHSSRLTAHARPYPGFPHALPAPCTLPSALPRPPGAQHTSVWNPDALPLARTVSFPGTPLAMLLLL